MRQTHPLSARGVAVIEIWRGGHQRVALGHRGRQVRHGLSISIYTAIRVVKLELPLTRTNKLYEHSGKDLRDELNQGVKHPSCHHP